MTDILLKISMSQSSIESISRFETKGLRIIRNAKIKQGLTRMHYGHASERALSSLRKSGLVVVSESWKC